ncbi:DUF63 family protein [Candidatus Micrarchaeota archaeon]|nr:DUF63 family protein [Candidatus Micrarchaeota archaeon]
MDISEFISKYYVDPIINHEGYNAVNTVTYAIIAIIALYLIYQWFKKTGMKVDAQFVYNTLPFVLFGSTVRVVTDSIDTGVMKAITPVHKLVLDSHIYDYGFLTSSPGIYVVTAALFFISLYIGWKMKNRKLTGDIGLILWIPHLLLLLPFMSYALYALPIILLALIPFYLALVYFKNDILAGIVGAHALDGAATFFVIDIFSKISGKGYFEQHVVPKFIGDLFGTFFTFYLVKVAIAFAAAYLIKNEKGVSSNERTFIALVLIIIGLAPGLRDVLRMMVGA